MTNTAPLFAPFTLGSLTVPNRFVMAPMTRGGSPGGIPGPLVVDYYRRRAEGGTGLIITEGTGVDHPASLGYNDYNGRDIPFMYGEAALAGWRSVVDAVHAAGGKIAPQLWHQGVMRLDGNPPFPEYPSARPSGIWGPANGRSTIAPEAVSRLLPETAPLSESEIGDIIAAFARSARHARDIGFDAIALHGAHGYLIDTFLWGFTNRRTDRYGGDAAARTRFGVEVVSAVRKAIGPDMPIILRFSQWKQQDFSANLAVTPQELEAILAPLADAGVDIFDASTRDFRHAAFPGHAMNLAGWARKLTGKPSMTVGGVGLDKEFNSSAMGDSLPASIDELVDRFVGEEFDLVALGRAQIADPDWVDRIRSGAPRSPFSPALLGTLY